MHSENHYWTIVQVVSGKTEDRFFFFSHFHQKDGIWFQCSDSHVRASKLESVPDEWIRCVRLALYEIEGNEQAVHENADAQTGDLMDVRVDLEQGNVSVKDVLNVHENSRFHSQNEIQRDKSASQKDRQDLKLSVDASARPPLSLPSLSTRSIAVDQKTLEMSDDEGEHLVPKPSSLQKRRQRRRRTKNVPVGQMAIADLQPQHSEDASSPNSAKVAVEEENDEAAKVSIASVILVLQGAPVVSRQQYPVVLTNVHEYQAASAYSLEKQRRGEWHVKVPWCVDLQFRFAIVCEADHKPRVVVHEDKCLHTLPENFQTDDTKIVCKWGVEDN